MMMPKTLFLIGPRAQGCTGGIVVGVVVVVIVTILVAVVMSWHWQWMIMDEDG